MAQEENADLAPMDLRQFLRQARTLISKERMPSSPRRRTRWVELERRSRMMLLPLPPLRLRMACWMPFRRQRQIPNHSMTRRAGSLTTLAAR